MSASDPFIVAAECARRLKLELAKQAGPEGDADLLGQVLLLREDSLVGQVSQGHGTGGLRQAAYTCRR